MKVVGHRRHEERLEMMMEVSANLVSISLISDTERIE